MAFIFLHLQKLCGRGYKKYEDEETGSSVPMDFFEPPPSNLIAGVKLQNLRKVNITFYTKHTSILFLDAKLDFLHLY